MKKLISILLLLALTFSVYAPPVVGRRIATPTTVASGGDPYFSSVQLLLHMNGTDGSTTFTDSSDNAIIVTAFGNAQLDTAEKKFGTASGLFDGNSDYLTCSDASLALGAGDYTVECFARLANTASNMGLFDIGIVGGGLNVVPYVSVVGSDLQWLGGSHASGLSANTWYHIAICRSGTTARLFLDGVEIDSYTESDNWSLSGLNVGLYYTTSFAWNGMIDDFRLTVGVARYTSNFTPPTSEFPNN